MGAHGVRRAVAARSSLPAVGGVAAATTIQLCSLNSDSDKSEAIAGEFLKIRRCLAAQARASLVLGATTGLLGTLERYVLLAWGLAWSAP